MARKAPSSGFTSSGFKGKQAFSRRAGSGINRPVTSRDFSQGRGEGLKFPFPNKYSDLGAGVN